MSLASLGLAASVIAFSVKFVNPRATFQVPPSPSSKAGDRVSIVIGVAAAETVADPNANAIPTAAKMSVPNVITFFGNKRGMSDEEAIANCIEGLNRVKKIGEDHGVTICVELLNSKVNHPDYQGDRTAFGVEIVKAVGAA